MCGCFCVYGSNQVKDLVYHRCVFSHLSSLISPSGWRKILSTLESLLHQTSYYHNEIEKKLKWKRLPPGDSVHMAPADKQKKAEGDRGATQELLLLQSLYKNRLKKKKRP